MLDINIIDATSKSIIQNKNRTRLKHYVPAITALRILLTAEGITVSTAAGEKIYRQNKELFSSSGFAGNLH